MQVRAHIPQFVGKRSLDDEVVENILLKQQEENNDEENLENVLMNIGAPRLPTNRGA
jgi:translation elongation factor EF-Ts